MLARALLLGLLALASFSSRAWATGPAAYPPGGSGSGVVANTCSAGDFFTAVDGSGNFTCATPSGSGDITAVGDCATGACFSGTTGNTLTAATGSFVLNTDSNIYLSFDTDNNSTGTGVVIGSNASGASATPWVVVSDAAGKNMTLRNATTLRINDPSDDTNYVEFTAPTIGSNVALTLPTSGGTVPSSATSPLALSAAGALSITADGIGSTELAATFTATTITSNLVGNVTGNADTSTALAANPTDCGADTYATTIGANGNLTCATVTNAGLAGSIAVSKTLLTAGSGLLLTTNDLTTASSEGSFITGTTSLPGTCSEGAMYQDTDSGGTELYVCTAANTWTKTVAATDNVATATALAANPTDCGANAYATTIAASGNLTCSAVDFGQLASGTNTAASMVVSTGASLTTAGSGTISATTANTATSLVSNPTDCGANQFATTIAANGNLTCAQPAFSDLSGTLAHSALSGLTSGDDHTQYALLAGRSGGQTLIGGTASGNDLTLQSTSNATRGSIFFGSEWEFLDEIPDTDDGTAYSGAKWSPTIALNGAAATASFTFAFDLNASMNLSDAAGIIVPTFGAIREHGTYTRSGAGTYLPAFYLFYSNPTLTSATDGLGPPNGNILQDQTTYSYTSTGSTTASMTQAVTVNSNPRIETNGGASTRLDVTNYYGVWVHPKVYETTGTLNLTTLAGLNITNVDVNATTPQITTQVGVDIAALSGATNNIGIRNAATSVFTPTTQAIAAVTDTITCDTTYKKFTTFTGTNVMTSNPTIANGQTGQICILENVDATATDCITLTDATVGMQLTASLTLCPNDTVMLVYDGTDWIQISTANN